MRKLSFLVLLAASFAVLPALADEDTTNRARALYTQGIELAKRAQWGEALAAFEQSLSLRPHPVTAYNVGNCERALGRYTRSRVMFARALADGTNGQLPPSLVEEAKGYLDEIDHALSHVDVIIDPPEAGIAVDGRPLATDAAFGDALVTGIAAPGPGAAPAKAKFELVSDPGTHVLTLSRKGYADIVVQRTFAAAGRTTLRLELERLPATLHISSNEEASIVTVNGADLGPAPVDVLRPGGSYRVVVRKDGFETYEVQAAAKAGEEVNLQASLIRKKVPITKQWWFWATAGAVVTGAAVGTYFLTRTEPDPKRPGLDGGNLGWTVQLR